MASRLTLLVLLALAVPATAAPDRTGAVRVQVVPDRDDWTYAVGAPAAFTIRVLLDGHPIKGATVAYRVRPEKMPATLEKTEPVPAEGLVVSGQTLQVPGFLRCEVETEVNGRRYRAIGTAAFAPEQIKPTIPDPSDFDAFWAAARKELAALPVNAVVVPLPDRAVPNADLFHVTLQNVPTKAAPNRDPGEGPPGFSSQIHGILCEPKGRGPFPAVLAVPGAGVRGYQGFVGLCARGFLTLQIGIHGLPVNLDREAYEGLGKGGLAHYPRFELDDRDRYYYRRVYLGAVRANDFLAQHPKFDRRNLGVIGGSQGGALAIVTAALDPRVRALVAYYPALSDLTGFLQGRAGGWPFLFRPEEMRTPEKLRTASYYDVVNFARRVKAPGWYSWGFNDEICPPTSMYAAYNVITAPKRLILALETGHFTTKEQHDTGEEWLANALRPLQPTRRRPTDAGPPR